MFAPQHMCVRVCVCVCMYVCACVPPQTAIDLKPTLTHRLTSHLCLCHVGGIEIISDDMDVPLHEQAELLGHYADIVLVSVYAHMRAHPHPHADTRTCARARYMRHACMDVDYVDIVLVSAYMHTCMYTGTVQYKH